MGSIFIKDFSVYELVAIHESICAYVIQRKNDMRNLSEAEGILLNSSIRRKENISKIIKDELDLRLKNVSSESVLSKADIEDICESLDIGIETDKLTLQNVDEKSTVFKSIYQKKELKSKLEI